MKNIFLYFIFCLVFIVSCNDNEKAYKDKKEYLNTFIFSTGLYLEKYCTRKSGAGMFDTGSDYEYILTDSAGHHLTFEDTSEDEFYDFRLKNDILYQTTVNQERDLRNTKELVFNYSEGGTKQINLTKLGFKVAKHNLDKSFNSIMELEKSMVYIEGGVFNMVSSWSENYNPENYVVVKSFYISKYEVTQELWYSVMGYNPSLFKDSTLCPVENIDWYETQKFISKLNKKYNTKYRLPTEAEWEYAARGGIKEKFEKDWVILLDTTAWYDKNSNNTTHKIGCKLPNAFGLYDMKGNVAEWCSDWYQSEYLKPDSTINQTKAVRGGSWSSNYAECIISDRKESHPKYGHENNIGFRLVLDYKQNNK